MTDQPPASWIHYEGEEYAWPPPPGWWQASNGRWYPADSHPEYQAAARPPLRVSETPPIGDNEAPPLTPWYRSVWFWVCALALLIVVLVTTDGGDDGDAGSTAEAPSAERELLQDIADMMWSDLAESYRELGCRARTVGQGIELLVDPDDDQCVLGAAVLVTELDIDVPTNGRWWELIGTHDGPGVTLDVGVADSSNISLTIQQR